VFVGQPSEDIEGQFLSSSPSLATIRLRTVGFLKACQAIHNRLALNDNLYYMAGETVAI